MDRQRQHIIDGLRDGTPIALGYFAVAFSLGIIAAKAGLTAPEGFLSSFFRLSGFTRLVKLELIKNKVSPACT